jgi:DNA-binding MarR family transcriptional regulator
MENETPRYATLHYDVRKRLDISWTEYMLLDMVYHLSFQKGYCYKSPGYIAEDLGLTKRSINYMIIRLVEKNLLYRGENNELQVKKIYYDIQVLGKGGKKIPTSSESGKKLPEVGNNFPQVGKNFAGWEKSTPQNYNKNDKRIIKETERQKNLKKLAQMKAGLVG